MIFFSKTENGFFDTDAHKYELPHDVVEIDETSYKNIISQHKNYGFLISSNDDGFPILIDTSIEQKEAENISFLSSELDRTEDAIKKLKRVIDRNIATEEERQHFDDLEVYSIELMRVRNQDGFPLKATFPNLPAWFK
ncbi:tail fiber assembly protein [Proteus terrae]|uniref:tail fiber assembly protein n=1 Tax=Proteus terrae TaxID=1574161 RepID=UPI0025AF1D65|nr:tail fiber assembly protein [Proteus terrae]